MKRRSETVLFSVENTAWHMARTTCPAWHMEPHQQPYHTKNVKTSNGQWSPRFSQKWVSSAMPQGHFFFGSAKYCGLGLNHLATVQSLSRLQYLIAHIRSKIIISKLIRQQLDYTQLEIGCPSQVLGQDYKRYSKAIL
jgi:hypothetical protein